MTNITRESSYPTPYANSPLLPLLLMSLAMQRNSPITKTRFKKSYDYIVVGSGAAGSVIARRLSDVGNVNVLLLEAGKPPPELLDVPSFVTNFIPTDVNQHYNTTPQKYTASALHDRQLLISVGKVLGGSTSTNGMVAIRLPQDYDYWVKQGAIGWGFKDVLPYFRKLENYTDFKPYDALYHGRRGPVTVDKPRYESIARAAWKKAIYELGHKIVDLNGPIGHGFYDLLTTTRNGQRCSTAKAYLVPAENRTNLDIVAEATVVKVLLKGKRAMGVKFQFQGIFHEVMSRKEVILSAGALGTPKILILSGIGPKAHLENLGIKVKANLPVGENLQTHTFSGFYYLVNQSLPSPEEIYKDENTLKQYIDSRTGFLTTTYNVAYMGFLNEKRCQVRPNYGLYLTNAQTDPIEYLAGSLKKEFIEKVYGPYKGKKFICCFPILAQPKSRGTFRLASKNIDDQPMINLNMLEDQRDVQDLVNAYKKCRAFGKTKALQEIGAKEFTTVYPGCEKYVGDDDQYFACVVRSVVDPQHHYAGTCKMGSPNDPNTVLDPELKVKGFENLRVADTSVMPTITIGNTMIPTIMIGEKASDMIKRDMFNSK